MSIVLLANEQLMEIFLYVGYTHVQTLVHLCRVCQLFHVVAREDYLWKQICMHYVQETGTLQQLLWPCTYEMSWVERGRHMLSKHFSFPASVFDGTFDLTGRTHVSIDPMCVSIRVSNSRTPHYTHYRIFEDDKDSRTEGVVFLNSRLSIPALRSGIELLENRIYTEIPMLEESFQNPNTNPICNYSLNPLTDEKMCDWTYKPCHSPVSQVYKAQQCLVILCENGTVELFAEHHREFIEHPMREFTMKRRISFYPRFIHKIAISPELDTIVFLLNDGALRYIGIKSILWCHLNKFIDAKILEVARTTRHLLRDIAFVDKQFIGICYTCNRIVEI